MVEFLVHGRVQPNMFEEFFFLQLHLLKLRLTRTYKSKGYAFENLGDGFNNFYSWFFNFCNLLGYIYDCYIQAK